MTDGVLLRGDRWPLPLRLPNPPSPLVGRGAMVKRLASLLERAPVAVVVGQGGIGKTSLVLGALHERFAGRVERTVFVALREGEAGEAPGLLALRALVRACGVERVDWPEVLHQPEAQTAMAIDLAERHGLWVVLDDLHRAPGAEALGLLRQLMRYARQSRWIATTREPLTTPDLVGQTLEVGPLPHKELLKLGRLLDAGAPTRVHQERARQAAGSPWALRHLVAARSAAAFTGSGPRMEDLDAEQQAWLGALRQAEVPVPEALLGALWSPSQIEAMRCRGALEATGAGLRVHEAASDALERGRTERAGGEVERGVLRRLGEALRGQEDTTMVAAGVRLLLRGGDEAGALAALEQQGERLLDAGYAPALWPQLPSSPPFAFFRLRCAVELGDPQALGAVTLPEPAPASARLLAARARLLRGDAPGAAEEARRARADASGPGEVFEAGYIEAQGLGNGGELRPAEALLAGLHPVDAGQAALRDALRAVVLGLLGEKDGATHLARAVAPVVPTLPWPLRGRVALQLARSLYNAGLLGEARAVIDEAIEQGGTASARLDSGRSLRFLRMCVAIDGGDLDRARAELERLEPYVGRGSLLGKHVELAWAHLLLAEGDLAAFEAQRQVLASRDLRGQLADELQMLDLRARLMRCERPLPDPPALPPSSIFAAMGYLFWSQLALRLGAVEASEARLPPGLDAGHVEVHFEAQLFEAQRRLLLDDLPGALSVLGEVEAESDASGWGLRRADAVVRAADVLWLLGDEERLERASGRLASVAHTSPPHRGAVALLDALRAPADWARIEQLARDERAPATAARCRALLGGPAPEDRIERRMIEAIGARLGRPRGLRAGPSWAPGWGLDGVRRALWRADGSWISLGEQPLLWSILEGLAAAGGEASKEALVLRVWKERSYHPLRHDNRLQAAVRKLRLRIEDAAARPRLLLTVADGYALGGVVRVVGLDAG